MSELSNELIRAIQRDFSRMYNADTKIKRLNKLLLQGTTDYENANLYSIRVGELLSKAFNNHINLDTLSGDFISRELANDVLRPFLNGAHDLIAKYTNAVQQAQNAAIGIGLKPQIADVNLSRIQGLIDKVSSYDSLDKATWVLKEPITNYCQSVVDDTEAKNMETYTKVGLQPKIKRIAEAGACKWCRGLEGTYDYESVEPKVYQRHESCRCLIIYENGKKRQDVHTKARWQVQEDYRRKEIIKERQEELKRQQIQKEEKRKQRNKLVEQVSTTLGYSPRGASAWLNANNKNIERLGLDYMIDITKQDQLRKLKRLA